MNVQYIKGKGWYVMVKLTDQSVSPAKVSLEPFFGPYKMRTQARGVLKRTEMRVLFHFGVKAAK